MSQQTILRHEVLKELDTGNLFDMVFITADRRRGTGGKIKRVSNWVKIIGGEQVSRLPGEFSRITSLSLKKNPSHGEHKTINIYNPGNPGDHATKVHWRLIIFFNGKRVLQ
ncbi:hypothetical protein FAM09_24845 [Niastella caeni]|uniref:Uncharacterized protein n=1 Tax=Niastella caeni TaxID=2569763 RepID=A0A4S8HGH2_9BACT|nr:hypothetical protein [Niastella caeni]THU34250.1 hypothetical protein FAM09_24845 [Niastella caeni]